MQQNQIIYGVLTRDRCRIRSPFWISHLNGFCASTHDVIVRDHAILCNEETSSGYCRLWFWRLGRVLAYTVHDRLNGGSTTFHVDSGQQRPVVILDLTLDASATLFMNSTDASVVDRVLLSPDVENVYCQGLVVGQSVTSDNRCCLLFPIQPFHLGLEIKITQPLSVPVWMSAI